MDNKNTNGQVAPGEIIPDKSYSKVEAAKLLGISVDRVYAAIKRGELRTVFGDTSFSQRIRGSMLLRYICTKEAQAKQTERLSECVQCIYYRRISTFPGADNNRANWGCHYCFDTGKKRGVPPKECYLHPGTPFTPKTTLK
jgi:hypothetical protein